MKKRKPKIYSDSNVNRLFRNLRNPTGLGSLTTFSRALGLNEDEKRKVARQLAEIPGYSRHVRTRVHYPTPATVVDRLHKYYFGDVAVMESLARFNGGIKYLSVVVDAFSMVISVVCLRTLTGKEMRDALKTHFKEMKRPMYFTSDQGTNYLSKEVQEFFKESNVIHIVSETPKKVIMQRSTFV